MCYPPTQPNAFQTWLMSHDQNEEKPLVQCNYSRHTILIMQRAKHNFKDLSKLKICGFSQLFKF
jgi:hypothetical protein